jgi:hypothetical protein
VSSSTLSLSPDASGSGSSTSGGGEEEGGTLSRSLWGTCCDLSPVPSCSQLDAPSTWHTDGTVAIAATSSPTYPRSAAQGNTANWPISTPSREDGIQLVFVSYHPPPKIWPMRFIGSIFLLKSGSPVAILLMSSHACP